MQNSTGINQDVIMLQRLIDEQASELSLLNQQLQDEIGKRRLLEERLGSSDQLLEEKIRSCERKMRAAFEAMTDIVLVINTQKDEIKDIEVLPTNLSFLNESETDIIGVTVEHFFQKDTKSVWWGKIQEALNRRQTLNFEYSLPLKKDELGRMKDERTLSVEVTDPEKAELTNNSIEDFEVWFTATISPISDQSVIWVARDISEQKQVQLELEATQSDLEQQIQRLHNEIRVRQRAEEEILFLLSTTQAIAEAEDFISALSIILRSCCETIGWDFGEAWIPNQDATLLEYSQSWYAREFSLEEFRNKSLTLKIDPNLGLPGRVWSFHKPEWIEDVSTQPPQIFQRATLAAEFGLKTAFGVPILFNNQVLAILVFFKREASPLQRHLLELINAIAIQLGSLIQRKKTEEALRIAEDKYHSIVENAVEGIFQSTPSGQYISANPALARIYGYDSPEELINSFQDISRQLYVDPNRHKEFLSTIEAEHEVRDFESLVYRQDGSTIWISENVRAVSDCEGELLYYEGTASDITERKLIQEALKFEQKQMEELLLSILPEPIAKRLQKGEYLIAERFEEVSVLFADLVGFTQFSARKTPEELVSILNIIFSKFDQLAQTYGLEKIKTIGDSYMVVGGLPFFRPDHAQSIAQMAVAMQAEIVKINHQIGEAFKLRIGINTGPVVAGVIGLNKFNYDLWGDTVNTASRMETNGIPGEIQVTATTYARLKEQFFFEERGWVPIKGKGKMITYLLRRRKSLD
ncbi:MAG: adenylate/guanylate cyclase domain-containing protein [Cyanobacteriota bacterium]